MAYYLMDNTHSVESIVKQLLPTTMLFRHIERVPVDECTADIRFLGQVVFDENYEWAVARLLATLDDALFHGDPVENSVSIRGLFHTPDVRWFHDREEFYKAVKDHSCKLMLLQSSPPGFVTEGELPPTHGPTVALAPDALTWKQLLPACAVELASVREGRVNATFALWPNSLVFKHETSKNRKRSVVVIYGTLVVNDPSKVLVLRQ